MHDLPRQTLSELLAEHGHGLCDDSKKLEGLLKDLLRNEYRRETIVLIGALREGVVHELRGSTSGMPPAALAEKLTRHLCDNLGLDDTVARWSVESWAVALGVEITHALAAPIKRVNKLPSTQPTPVSSPEVDLAAIVLQHREKARQEELKAEQDRLKAAQAAAITAQRRREADLLAAEMARKADLFVSQMARKTKANALSLHREAKQLAEQTRNFAAAAQMLEVIDPQWRDAKFFETICGYRDKVAHLNAVIQNAVQNGQLNFLRRRVLELLKLQPKRDDMRRLLEVLPHEPELAKELTNSIGMKYVLIQPGEFMMGSNVAGDERPPHLVEISQPFYLGVFPVTQAEYEAVIGTNPSHFNGNGQLPVEHVNWHDAIAFCEKLSQLWVEVQNGISYRLPTEAEWEYACRAGATDKWCSGDDVSSLCDYAWLSKNSDSRTHPVGEKSANNWGLHDMHGNVWEWCADWYRYYETGILSDPRGQTIGSLRVSRGGSWNSTAGYCRSAFRSRYDPSYRDYALGFRLALSPSGL